MDLVWLGWLLMLISGMADGGSRNLIKSSKIHQYTLVCLGTLISIPFYLVSLGIEGMPLVEPGFWYAVVLHVPISAAIRVLTIKAHRSSPLMLTVPYTALTPVFLLFTSPFMGSGLPTVWGVIGVLIIVAGLYAINIRKAKMDFFEPFLSLRREKGSQYMIVCAFLMALGSNLDLIALQNANPSFYLIVDSGLVFLIMLAMTGQAYIASGYNRELITPKTHGVVLLLFGLMNAVTALFHNIGMSLIPYVPLVIAVKRAGKIIWTVAIGLFLAYILKRPDYQSEKEDLGFRLIGTLAVIAGVLLVMFFGPSEIP